MPTKTPKLKYGVSHLYYAPITAETEEGVITYGTPVMLPGAVSISLTAQGERRYLSADNTTYFEAWSNGGYEGDITIAMIPDHFRQACLGEKTDAAENSSVTYETTELITQHFALLWQCETDAGPLRYALYYCTASRPQIAAQSLDGESGLDPSQATETISISAKGRRIDNIIKAKETDSTSQTYEGWFAAVYVPLKAVA